MKYYCSKCYASLHYIHIHFYAFHCRSYERVEYFIHNTHQTLWRLRNVWVCVFVLKREREKWLFAITNRQLLIESTDMNEVFAGLPNGAYKQAKKKKNQCIKFSFFPPHKYQMLSVCDKLSTICALLTVDRNSNASAFWWIVFTEYPKHRKSYF